LQPEGCLSASALAGAREVVAMTIENLVKMLATGGAHLGDLVWWALSDASIDRKELEKKWAATGLAPELLPEAPTTEKAFKLAVRETQVGQHDRLIRLAKDDEETVVFGVVREEKLDDGTLVYTQEARVALEHKTGTITTDAPTHDVVTAIRARFDKHRDTHTADDVRRTINRTLGSFSAVLLRENGGVWWVPTPHAKNLRALQTAIEGIGQSKMYLLPVHDSADAGRALGDAAAKSLEEELAALKAEVEGFVTNPPRVSTLARRFDAFEALRSRAELYKTILKVQVKDLDTTLNQLTESVEGLLESKAA
jgi:hypothetical protein